MQRGGADEDEEDDNTQVHRYVDAAATSSAMLIYNINAYFCQRYFIVSDNTCN